MERRIGVKRLRSAPLGASSAVGNRETLEREIAAWELTRNTEKASVNWRFKIRDARNKMERLYPPISPSKVAVVDY